MTPERVPHGHPLDGGHPERVTQEFRNAYHSTREEQSDTVPDSGSETEEEEWMTSSLMTLRHPDTPRDLIETAA